mmetsp:Transcript_18969/g.38904  ORF Transcript_18969/g.38904 Transcript_18969/m.38904 type:complete len:108 (+) Transcript_18969:1052-1375(+)
MNILIKNRNAVHNKLSTNNQKKKSSYGILTQMILIQCLESVEMLLRTKCREHFDGKCLSTTLTHRPVPLKKIKGEQLRDQNLFLTHTEQSNPDISRKSRQMIKRRQL